MHRGIKYCRVVSLILIPLYFSFLNPCYLFTVYYYLDKEAIASELCEKKEVVDNLCHGKCYLNKKIASAMSKEPSQSNHIEIPQVGSIAHLLVDSELSIYPTVLTWISGPEKELMGRNLLPDLPPPRFFS